MGGGHVGISVSASQCCSKPKSAFKIVFKKKRCWAAHIWAHILTLPLTRHLTLSKSINLSDPQFSHLKYRGTIAPDC